MSGQVWRDLLELEERKKRELLVLQQRLRDEQDAEDMLWPPPMTEARIKQMGEEDWAKKQGGEAFVRQKIQDFKEVLERPEFKERVEKLEKRKAHHKTAEEMQIIVQSLKEIAERRAELEQARKQESPPGSNQGREPFQPDSKRDASAPAEEQNSGASGTLSASTQAGKTVPKPSEAEPTGAADNSGTGNRKGYRTEVRQWMKRKKLKKIDQAASKLGVSPDVLKSIMSDRGKPRFGKVSLQSVLKQIGYKDE